MLRLGLAVICLYHGLDKTSGPRNEQGANWHYLGLPPPPDLSPPGPEGRQPWPPPNPDALSKPAQLAIAWGQVLIGVALLFGALTPLAALAAALIFVVEGSYTVRWNFHWQNGFALFGPDNKFAAGFEYTLAIHVMCAAVLFLGAGLLSVDHWVLSRWKKS